LEKHIDGKKATFEANSTLESRRATEARRKARETR
jgi:hypothetical protein